MKFGVVIECNIYCKAVGIINFIFAAPLRKSEMKLIYAHFANQLFNRLRPHSPHFSSDAGAHMVQYSERNFQLSTHEGITCLKLTPCQNPSPYGKVKHEMARSVLSCESPHVWIGSNSQLQIIKPCNAPILKQRLVGGKGREEVNLHFTVSGSYSQPVRQANAKCLESIAENCCLALK